MTPFTIARLPRILFGAGSAAAAAGEIAALGRRVLIVTGARSFRATPHWDRLLNDLTAAGVAWEAATAVGEPSPHEVDAMVAAYKGGGFAAVVGIGGGSALDTAKAVAGLLPGGLSVLDYLEGVGPERPYRGPSLPFIAMPTTAGSGSEATKNAVLSVRGADGYKKSFRDEQLTARTAIVDPDLLATCPQELMAADGMDALTQLLESYVSLKADPMTEALVWSGMDAFQSGFFSAWGRTEDAAAGRSRTAYASLMSGIALAQTGLGSVHGLASPLGAFFPIPHGLVCGSLVAEAVEINIRVLKERQPDSPALGKYAKVGALLAGRAFADRDEALAALVETLRRWVRDLAIPRLGRYGVTPDDAARVTAASRGGSMKTNPIVLTDAEITELVLRRV